MTDHPVTRLLVANRGEIARRIVATCRRLGIDTVAVCSDPDVDAAHVREADRAVRLPGSVPAQTYLRADLLVEAAVRSGADAVHPGYGFLSESAAFAEAVLAAGLTWVGPPPAAIAAMGSKVAAKQRVAEAGMPVLSELDPGAVTAADLPLLVKASAGGGGRGMRIVRDLAELPALVRAASTEAASAFGDPTVFVEPFVEDGHHVEVQVLADASGEVVVLGERECSIQRRHQKIVEESPSPLVERTPGLRERLFEAAVAVARSVAYESAGTVEFLVDGGGRFWFLEMNTRLQVEHPVTECRTGLDLVELQLHVARGAPLADVLPAGGRHGEGGVGEPRGAAIEVRLYAEDPAQGWRPSTGTLHRFAVDATVPAFTVPDPARIPRGVRVDAAVGDGDGVGVHYDPMLAKLIAWAPTRDEAARLLARAVTSARVHGLRTNRDLLANVLRHRAFLAGDTDTAFLDRHGLAGPDGLAAPTVPAPDERLAAVAAALAGAALRRAHAPVLAGLPSGWRNVPTALQTTTLVGPRAEHRVGYRCGRAGGVTVEVDGGPLDVRLVTCRADAAAGRAEVVLETGGLLRRWDVAVYGQLLEVDGDAGAVTFHEPDRFPEPGAPAVAGSLVAPLPGTVVAVHVRDGDEVTAGQELLVVEAMKMQHVVRADRPGTVEQVRVAAGDGVEVGAVLVVLASEQEETS